MSYNSLVIEHNGTQYVFVTRGRAKPFTFAEAVEYFDEPEEMNKEELTDEDIKEASWCIPDDKSRKLMFLKDIRISLDFASKKYGVSRDEIIREARRIAPHMNVE